MTEFATFPLNSQQTHLCPLCIEYYIHFIIQSMCTLVHSFGLLFPQANIQKKVAHMLCEYSLFISSQRESTNHTTVVIFFLFSTKKKFYFVSFENKQQQETEFHLAFVHVLYSNPGTSRLFTFCTI